MNYQDIFFILTVVASAGVIVLAIIIFNFKTKWNALFGSSETKEAVISSLLAKNIEFEKILQHHDARLKITETITERSIHKIGFLRFNPFSETGGDNSFALTMLDRADTGVIISSLYTREGVRVYAKAIENGKPKNQLSEEETASLKQALQEHQKNDKKHKK
ncbi:MAG: DUF4446 family protein [Patescibacteria group bacterium]